MRQALNENPVVQVVMLGILGIVVAFLFMTRVMGGDEAAAPEATDTASTSTAAGGRPGRHAVRARCVHSGARPP